MKKKPSIFKFYILLLNFVIANLLLSCGSFKGSSYFDSDGIYVSQFEANKDDSKVETNDNYYEQYFKDAADNGYVDVTEEDIYFTDSDSYNSTDQYQNNTGFENDNLQIPWGGDTSQTEINIINNSPNFRWGLMGFGLGYSPFWNNYYADRFQFGFGGFYSPFMDYHYWNPYRGYAGMWGGFNSFYSPFGFYGGFYNPYGFGFRNGFRNQWANRWNRFDDYYGNNLNQRNRRDYRSTVARIKSGRGEKNYNSSRERTREKTQNVDSKQREVQNTLNRINAGRSGNLIGRNVVIGYDRTKSIEKSNIKSVRNLRPGISLNSTNRTIRRNYNNTNLRKSPQGLYTNSGRTQTQYRLVGRNPNRSNTLTQGRTSRQVISRPNNSRNPRSTSRIVRQTSRNQGKNTTKYNYSRSQRNNNYNRSNSSYSINRSSVPSYNSGGRSSSGRTGSSGSRGGRTN
tara:strand:- start:4707 stop:6071 length:1365 start_codon:yes stop_codon:yes gene_type:complete